MIPPLCGCLEGYFPDAENKESNDCVKCGTQCKSCDKVFTCKECKNPSMYPPYCNSEKSNFSVDIGG